jgi:hypothetical protein
MMEKAFPMLLVLYFVMWIFVFCFGLIYKRRLRMLYPDLGASLYPGLLRKSVATDFKSVRFVLRGEYQSLDNPNFVTFCNRYRALLGTWFIVFGVTFVAMIVVFAIHTVK